MGTRKRGAGWIGLVVAAALFAAGCGQGERRYEAHPTASGVALLVDRDTGCVWMLTLPRRFVEVPVEGRPACVERAAARESRSLEGKAPAGQLIDDAGILKD
jgi:hypothetical protein